MNDAEKYTEMSNRSMINRELKKSIIGESRKLFKEKEKNNYRDDDVINKIIKIIKRVLKDANQKY